MSKEATRVRQMAALQSRHDAGITDKMIGHAIGRHPDTVGNWRTGRTLMDVADLMLLDNLFASMGDWMFLEAVCGELAVRRRRRAQQLRQQAQSLEAQADFFAAEPESNVA